MRLRKPVFDRLFRNSTLMKVAVNMESRMGMCTAEQDQPVPGWTMNVIVRNPEKSGALQQFMNLPTFSSSVKNPNLEFLIKSSQEGGFQFPSNLFDAEEDLGRNHLERHDMRSDAFFYDQPRFVTHIDGNAIASLTSYYQTHLEPHSSIVDLCSSWISHLPTEGSRYAKVVGIGMNEEELKANKQLSQYFVQDLNKNPHLKMLPSASFDAVLMTVSVDYLIRPFEVFAEVVRILKPGGSFIVSFSNRMFPTKVIKAWLHSGDPVHLYIVAFYFQAVGDQWERVTLSDITYSKDKTSRTDPMYVVHGIKKK